MILVRYKVSISIQNPNKHSQFIKTLSEGRVAGNQFHTPTPTIETQENPD